MMLQSATPLLAAIALNTDEPPRHEAAAPSGDRAHSHTHAHDEIDEVQGPLLLEATYTGEVMANAARGVGHDFARIGRLQKKRSLDLVDLVMSVGVRVRPVA